MTDNLIANSRLTPQSYGIAMAQGNFGGPRGVWLECACGRNDVIVGSKDSDGPYGERLTNSEAAEIFRFHGWTGEGPQMLKQRCPTCSTRGEA